MKLRVNLLRPEEQRYQGPVSLRFALLIGAATFGAIALLVLAVGLHAFFSVRGDLRAAREAWQTLEPRFNTITALQKAESENRMLLAELDRWGKLRTPWTGLLQELQRITPASLQLTRLVVRSEWVFVKPPAAVTSDGKEIPLPAIPARKIYLSLEGRAAGELADEVVVTFVRTLRQSQGFEKLFESVKLQRLVRATAGGTERQTDRLFLIEGEFLTRKLE